MRSIDVGSTGRVRQKLACQSSRPSNHLTSARRTSYHQSFSTALLYVFWSISFPCGKSLISIDWAPYEKTFSNTLVPLVCLGFYFKELEVAAIFYAQIHFWRSEKLRQHEMLCTPLFRLAVRRKLKQQKSVLPSESSPRFYVGRMRASEKSPSPTQGGAPCVHTPQRCHTAQQ